MKLFPLKHFITHEIDLEKSWNFNTNKCVYWFNCHQHYFSLSPPDSPTPSLGDVKEMESPTEITADQEEQTKQSNREGEKTGQKKLSSLSCLLIMGLERRFLKSKWRIQCSSWKCVFVWFLEILIHGENVQSEPCASPKRPLSPFEDTDDTIPPKRLRAQEDQVRLTTDP